MNNVISAAKKSALAISLIALSSTANAKYSLELDTDNSLTFGGYIKVDTRYVSGDIAATNYWTGGGKVLAESEANFGIFANETRFNTKYVHGDVSGFIEIDFYGEGSSGGGNELISNSSKPRLRHAFIQYKNALIGQTWTTFQNTSALAETADFAGPIVASAFIRQGQIRYTYGGLQIAIENPETYGGNNVTQGGTASDGLPDFIGKYTFSGDWGNVSLAGLARQLESATGNTESAIGYGVSGKINTFGKDDLRFQVHAGNVGRYVGVTAITDMVGEEVEQSTSIMAAYRHFWTDTLRSSVFYGYTTTEESDRERSHVGLNVFQNLTKELSFGLEAGSYEIADNAPGAETGDSLYLQLSTKFVL